MAFKIKISLDDITYGPKDEELDPVVIFDVAGHLSRMGYRRTSNAYCMAARIDREDWLDVLSKHMNCAKADFYMPDGSGVSRRWEDHYIRCYSNDKITVHPQILRKLESA